MTKLIKLDEFTELFKWDERDDGYVLISKDSYGGVSFSASNALALANAIYDDLGYGWKAYPENKPENKTYWIHIESEDGGSGITLAIYDGEKWIYKDSLREVQDRITHYRIMCLPQPYGGKQ